MTYGTQSLGQNEKLIYEAHFHILYYAAAWLAFIILIVLALSSLIEIPGTVKWVLPIACAAGLAVVAARMKPVWTTEIAVTTHRLIIKRGWLTRSTTELQLRNIEQVNFHQGLLGKIFNFGQITVHGTGVDDMILPSIACPTDLVKAIENASIPVRQPPLVAASPSSA